MSDIPEKTRKLIQARADGRCELDRQPMTDIHHRLRKGMGGTNSPTIHDPCNLLALCRFHHGWVHGNVALATAGGWIVPTSQDPASALVWMQSTQYAYPGWFLLDNDACVQWMGETDEPKHLPPGMPSLRLDPWALDNGKAHSA